MLYFEPQPPAEYPYLAAVMATTHDLPTLAGLWTGQDLAAQPPSESPANDQWQRLRRHYGHLLRLPAEVSIECVIEATYHLLAHAPSAILLATLEDALAVAERPNMPGTIGSQWPNWSLALPGGLEALETAELPRRIAKALRRP